MKKTSIAIILVIILCVIFLGGTFVLWKNPKLANQIILSFEDFYDNITGNSNIEYSNDFKVNDLQCKNADFYYNTLTENQKVIYSNVANSVKNMDKKVKLKKYQYVDQEIAGKDIDTALQGFLCDHPEVFYVDNKYTITSYDNLGNTRIELDLNYLVEDKQQRDKQLNEVKEKIDAIVQKYQDKSGFEAELAVHDTIGKEVEYYTFENLDDVPAECHNIYGTLVNKKAVCDGFAKTMKILLDRLNIESIIVMGSLEDQLHAWNLVKLEDEWYHLDLTSNKSIDGLDSNKNIVVHSYFNITTPIIEKTHKIDNVGILPQTTAIKYNYYVYSKKYITAVDDFNDTFRDIVKNNKDEILEIKVKDVFSVPEKMVNVLRANKFTDYLPDSATKFSYYSILDTYILVKAK